MLGILKTAEQLRTSNATQAYTDSNKLYATLKEGWDEIYPFTAQMAFAK